MEKFEIGTDIQKVKEFENVSIGFLRKAFSESEIAYCLKKSEPAQHFAARFAVKESVIKASSQFGNKLDYTDIEILIKRSKPILNIKKTLKGEYTTKISMSHSGNFAVGFALMEKNGSKGKTG